MPATSTCIVTVHVMLYWGCGGICDRDWFMTKWEDGFIEKYNPSIEYLELYAVTVVIFNWIQQFSGKHVSLFCDNMSVVFMINNKTSSCKNCIGANTFNRIKIHDT